MSAAFYWHHCPLFLKGGIFGMGGHNTQGRDNLSHALHPLACTVAPVLQFGLKVQLFPKPNCCAEVGPFWGEVGGPSCVL